MTNSKQIYRGYDIEQRDGAWFVSKDGESLRFTTEEAALAWVDADRRKKPQTAAAR